MMVDRLRVIDGGSLTMRRDEAHIEAITLCDEVLQGVGRIVSAITALPVPSMSAVNEATRLAYRADFAKAELIALTAAEKPDGAA